MKIALVGTGNMGQAVEALALGRGHEIVARFDVERPFTAVEDPSALGGADVVVDFSLPGVVLDHIERYCRWDLTAVIGTTGWYDALEEVERQVSDSRAALLYAPNFSIGVALLVRALRRIGPMLDDLPEYDMYVHEIHHTGKVDSPSGTALMLGETLLEYVDRKTHVVTETQHQRIDPAALHVSSSRAGEVFGEHTVGFDSPFDHIRFEHVAKNRRGFAFGALKAAEWLLGRQGLFTLDDVLVDGLGAA